VLRPPRAPAGFNQLAALPPQISGCSRLSTLSLPDNEVAELPHELCSLGRLQRLVAGGNKLEALPDGLGALSQLQELDCGDNDLLLLPPSAAELRELRVRGGCSRPCAGLPGRLAPCWRATHSAAHPQAATLPRRRCG
jgi:hypothetical protein